MSLQEAFAATKQPPWVESNVLCMVLHLRRTTKGARACAAINKARLDFTHPGLDTKLLN